MSEKAAREPQVAAINLQRWHSVRERLVLAAVALVGFAAWMVFQFGDWGLTLMICGPLLAFVALVGFGCRRVILGR